MCVNKSVTCQARGASQQHRLEKNNTHMCNNHAAVVDSFFFSTQSRMQLLLTPRVPGLAQLRSNTPQHTLHYSCRGLSPIFARMAFQCSTAAASSSGTAPIPALPPPFLLDPAPSSSLIFCFSPSKNRFFFVFFFFAFLPFFASAPSVAPAAGALSFNRSRALGGAPNESVAPPPSPRSLRLPCPSFFRLCERPSLRLRLRLRLRL